MHEFCPTCGNDTFLCQVCGTVHCGYCEGPPFWVELVELTRPAGVRRIGEIIGGNVCGACRLAIARDCPPKHPGVKVDLSLIFDPFALVQSVKQALQAGGVTVADREQFARDAFSGDRTHLLATVAAWVTAEGDRP